MSWLSKLLKGAAPIVSAVAPFIPGGQAIGALAGGYSALSAGKDADRQAEEYARQIANSSQGNDALVSQYLPQLLQQYNSLISQAPPEVSGQNLGDPYGLIARARNNNPYNEGVQRLLTGQLASRQANDTQGAVEALRADTNSLGVVNSSDLVTGIRRIRQAAANNVANTRSDLAVRGAEYGAESGRQAEEATYNRRMGEENTNYQRGQLRAGQIGSLLPLLLQLQNSGIGGLGGLQQHYASRADSIGGSLGSIVGELSKAGIFGNKRPTTAGDSTYGTNQAGTPPYVPTGQGLKIYQPQANIGVDALRRRQLKI